MSGWWWSWAEGVGEGEVWWWAVDERIGAEAGICAKQTCIREGREALWWNEERVGSRKTNGSNDEECQENDPKKESIVQSGICGLSGEGGAV